MTAVHWGMSRLLPRPGLRMAVLALLPATLASGLNAQSSTRTTNPADTMVTAAELSARRAALAERIGDGVLVAFGGRNPVTDLGGFRQLPSFRYLTELNEPDHALVMVIRKRQAQSTLFLTALDPRTAFYYGIRADSASALKRFGIPGRSFSALTDVLDSLAGTGLPFYHVADIEAMDFARDDSLTRGQETMKALAARHPSLELRNGMPILLEMRAKKSETELALIRRAAEISAEGHKAAMAVPNPGHEYDLRAALEYTFTKLGAERPSYGSIVGGGINGTTLHYMADMAPLGPNDLVVMDAGAEFRGYAADITRTIPVSGSFTPEQRRIYQLVRDAQQAAEDVSGPGLTLRGATDSSVAVRTRGLAKLGLIESEDATFDPPWKVNCNISPATCKQANLWMIHGITHGIGLEVHDPMQGSGRDATYKPGDVFTIEPGIYISTRALSVLPDTPKNRAFIARVKSVVEQYENIGVRIEDDYIITNTGLERITTTVQRELDEVEAFMREQRRMRR